MAIGFMSASMLVSCIDDENFAEGSDVSLSFSADTLKFDTVFTQMGSLTKQILVYNKESKAIKINSIRLGGGSASFFRINVDGDASSVVRDVEIRAKDSMYIFVKVTVNPTNQNNPLLIADSIILNYNNKNQAIFLQAYGQDAYYHLPTDTLLSFNGADTTFIPISFAHNDLSSQGIIANGTYLTMKSDKPHIILGTYAVDSLYHLSIEAGCKIHFGTQASLWIYRNATINVGGSQNDPVIFQGIRTDGLYATSTGQWDRIWIWTGSNNNSISDAIIRNGTIGILIDSSATDTPNLQLKNVRIENMAFYGIYAQEAHLVAGNLIVTNCGRYCVALNIGGKYQFVHSTIANYGSAESTSASAGVLLNNYYIDANNTMQIRQIEQADFINTIIYGSKQEQITIDKADESSVLNYSFRNCLLRTQVLTPQSPNIFSCIFNSDPLFIDVNKGDFGVSAGSPAIGAGDSYYSLAYPTDIYGYPRYYVPTIGAIEYQSK